MPEFCTCGAQLPDDARFCHKCGKSQRPDPVPEAEESATDLTQRAVPAAAPTISGAMAAADTSITVGFDNPFALRASFFAASMAVLLDLMPILNLFAVLWALGAGFAAVMIYKRRTGQGLSVRNGAKLGWITGVLTLVLLTVLLTVMVVIIATNWPMMRELLVSRAGQDPRMAELLRVIEDRNLLLTVMPVSLVLTFSLFAGACVAGGALGAKVTSKD